MKPGSKIRRKQTIPLKAEDHAARFDFAGHGFAIVDKTALYWPAQDALLVADLHLEKGSWFAVRGQMLPPYDSIATLDRLFALVEKTRAQSIWALGDNFHDEAGPDRMAPEVRSRLDALSNRCALHWITGNHDEQLPASLGGAVHDEAELGGLVLRHRAEELSALPELSGHWHPKVSITARGRKLTRPCFVRGERKLILPAFGAYTGGMAAHDPAILALTSPGSVALIAGTDGVLSFPLSTPLRKG